MCAVHSNTFPVDVQVDTNRDRLVSLNEFIAATKKDKFLEKDEWEVGLPPQDGDVISVVMISCRSNISLFLMLRLWSRTPSTRRRSCNSLNSSSLLSTATSTGSQRNCTGRGRSSGRKRRSLTHRGCSYSG